MMPLGGTATGLGPTVVGGLLGFAAQASAVAPDDVDIDVFISVMVPTEAYITMIREDDAF